MRPWQILTLSVLLSFPGICGAGDDPGAGKHRPFSDAEYWAGVFDSADRTGWQKPVILLDLLGLQEGEIVAEIGAGTGYFTQYLALKVGDEGKVFAVDTEQAMLDWIKGRDDITNQHRIEPVLAEPDDPNLPPREVDLIVVLNTWHHIENRPRYLRRLVKTLSPEGRLTIVDFREGDLPVGPPAGTKLARDEVVRELERARWRLVSESFAFPYQYFLTFYPPKKKRG